MGLVGCTMLIQLHVRVSVGPGRPPASEILEFSESNSNQSTNQQLWEFLVDPGDQGRHGTAEAQSRETLQVGVLLPRAHTH